MTIPTQEKFQQPLLKYLNSQARPVRNELVHAALAVRLRLTSKERAERDSLGRAKYKNLIAWAYVNLQKKGLCIPMTKAKEYQLSPQGRRVLRTASRVKSRRTTDRPPQVPTGAGFGDSEQNRKIEQTAIRIVTQWYRRDGWRVASVEPQRCGFDLLCKRDGTEEVHVEVKGAAGNERRFIITAGELRRATNDDRFVLALVTNTLTKHPNLARWSSANFRSEFDFEPIQFWAMAKTKKATASPNHGRQPTRKKAHAADA